MIEIHTADLHFGAMDPKVQYEILSSQLTLKVRNLNFDAFFINGDIFHHKYMSNSDVIMYASKFINDIVMICIEKGATLVMLHGTGSHDANQLKLFYHYIGTPGLDIRIVETASFEDIKGTRVLCLPEQYGMGKEYYENFLKYGGVYDMAVLHGAIKGSIFGADKEDLDSAKAPVFSYDSFVNCRGPIICGHVHVSNCFNDHIYYSGSPLRWQFGEEDPKGFIVLLLDPFTHQYYVHLEEITSFKYCTYNLSDLTSMSPDQIIREISLLKSRGVDYIKIKFDNANENTNIVKEYYKNSFDTVIDVENAEFVRAIQENQKINDKYAQYNYILDPNLSPYEIFVRYVNQQQGSQFITVDDLQKLLSE